MVKKKDSIKWGPFLYFLGVILVAIAGIIVGLGGQMNNTIISILVILGLIVGFLNISEDEVERFLISGIALIVASTGLIEVFTAWAKMNGALVGIMGALAAMLYSILWFVSPAIVVVALKAIVDIMQD